jgi:hypothetical protein
MCSQEKGWEMARQSTTDDIQKLLAMGFAQGETIPWAAIEEVLAPLTRGHRRFKTVYRALIAHLRKWQNRKVVVIPGVGLRVLYEHERAKDVVTTVGRTIPILDRATKDADDIPVTRLEGLHLDEAHHTRVFAHRMKDAASSEIARLMNRPGRPLPTPAAHAVG